jgi:hypothetical protein
LSTQVPFRHPGSPQEYDVYIDGNGDGVADAVLFTARIPASTLDTDVMVTELFNLNTGDLTVEDALNASLGDTDTAIFDSDTFVMPIPIADIPGVTADQSRINYAVLAFDGYHSGPLDQVGDVDGDGNIVGGLSMDVLHPGLTVSGTYNRNSSPLLFEDSPGSVLAIRRDAASYAADHGLGALMVHFHNEVGQKAQVVSLNKQASSTSLHLSPNPVRVGKQVTATIHVTGSVPGVTPTGTVTLKQVVGSSTHNVGTATLNGSGTATVKFTATTAGTRRYVAAYGGDGNYAASNSSTATLTIMPKVKPAVKLSMSPNPVQHGKPTTVTITVSGSGGTATGTVRFRRLDGPHPGVTRTVTLSNGKATLTYRPGSAGRFHYRADYSGDSNYNAANSASVALKIT